MMLMIADDDGGGDDDGKCVDEWMSVWLDSGWSHDLNSYQLFGQLDLVALSKNVVAVMHQSTRKFHCICRESI